MTMLFEKIDTTIRRGSSFLRVQISTIDNDLYQKIHGRFTEIGYEKYHYLIDEYNCDSIELCHLENPFIKNYKSDINLNLISNKENIRAFYLTGDGSFSKDFDEKIFHDFFNVKAFYPSFKFGKNMTSFFPNLEALHVWPWRFNKIKNLGNAWPKLRYLGLNGFNDDLHIFEGRDLKRIFTQSSTVSNFDNLLIFPNLEALSLTFPRGEGDVSKLSNLKSLVALNIEGGKKFTGWEDFYSTSLIQLEASYCPLIDLKAHFPNLERYVINHREDNIKINPVNKQVRGSNEMAYKGLTWTAN
ncbi:hypothetical protein [Bartonella sp. HY406]|uniref:hypothetical protein n=1 Tax=Bartonella sp. HY406 TaxID=2979331 RepID=UPI0021CA6449|nr:hypothetical protein [Bartonella sp. HY406]UXN02775.1 hypothetical protein N6B01_09870 [Bartonella sp. HY406]